MDYMADVTRNYTEELVRYIDLQAKTFLEKNDIPFTNMEETQKLLQERGYRLISEKTGTFAEDIKTTLLLVKIIDQTSYTIKAPEIKIA